LWHEGKFPPRDCHPLDCKDDPCHISVLGLARKIDIERDPTPNPGVDRSGDAIINYILSRLTALFESYNM